MPTSLQDPERARRQRLQYPPQDESDWTGLLLGLAAMIVALAVCIGGMHLYLRFF